MNPGGNLRYFPVINPAAIVDDAAFTTATIDTQGAYRVQILVHIGATDIAAAVFKVQESDASNMGSATDISGTDLASTVTAGVDNTIIVYDINLAGNRKRYLDLSFTAGNGSLGTYASAVAILWMKNSPTSNTERNVTAYTAIN